MTDNLPDRAGEFAGLAQLAQSMRRTRSLVAPPQPREADPRPPESMAGHSASSPFQFRLRTMLGVVAALSGLLAAMQFVGAVWSAILIWFLLLVIAHIMANFWGTRVAPGAGRPSVSEQQPGGRASCDRPAATASGSVRLSESLRPGWPMLVVTAAGVILGGSLGGVALFILSLDRAGYAGVVVGTISAAAVGGFLGFLTSSCAEISLRAWNEAVCGTAGPAAGE